MRSDLPPAALEQPRRPRRLPYSMLWPILCGAGVGLLIRLSFSGGAGDALSAMLASFIIGAPVVVGVVTVYLAELEVRRTWAYYFVSPVIATSLLVVSSLAIYIEGLICAILIVPLFAIVGGLAGLAMGAICRATNWPRPTIVGCIAVLPFIFGSFEQRLPRDHLERVQLREVFVAAPPSAVWRVLVDTRDIRRDEVDAAWMYRIGVPVPIAGAGESRDGEHLRHITMGKGIRFDQVATEWRPLERVTWAHRFTPDSFPAGALDDHVRIGGEYFDVGATTYALRTDGAGTRLSVQMRYRVSTHFNWYAGPVADFLVGDFAERILDFYAQRARPIQAPASP
jgi:hypothetical protein